MASTMLSIRNSNLSTFNAVAINYSTLSGTTTILTSTMVSIGVGNNKTYSTLSQGNFTSTSNWVTSLTGRSSTIGVSMSANAQTQLVVSQVSTATSVQYTSTLGTQWSSISGSSGLPNSLQTSYSAGAISGDGRYGVLGTTTGELFVTSNAGQTFSGLNTASPAIYLPLDTVPANGSSSSGTAPTTLTVVGPPTQAPSFVIGSGAINLANTPGSGNATQYIRGSWTVPANFAVRLWFNMQSPPTSNIEFLFSTGTVANGNDTILYIDTARRLVLKIPGGVTIYSSLIVTVNTWYNVFFTIQSNGACSLYANNIVVGTGTSTATALSTGNFGIGTYDAGGASLLNPFAGYIDDIKIYNTTIPFTNQFPSQPFTTLAVSNSGQYMLAAMANQGLYMSSNYGSTWTQVTSAMLYAAWTAAQVSATGQYLVANSPVVNVQPQLTGLIGSTTVVNAITTWQVNGVSWTSSASSAASATNNSYLLFNNTVDYWVSALGSYNGAGVNNGTKSTVVIGQGTVTGEYVQLQSSVSIQLYSYTFTSGDYRQYPKTLTFAGSNDGVTWYLLQSVTMSGNPVGTAGGSTSTSYIIINQSGAQPMITSSGSAIFTCTTSQYSANPYTYVRMIIPSIFGDSGFTALAELFLRFTAGGQTYSTNYGSSWNNSYALYTQQPLLNAIPIIQPQQVGLAANTWTKNGITWTAYGSSNYDANAIPYKLFNTVINGSDNWACADNLYPSGQSFNYITSGTTSTIVSAPLSQTIKGEYFELQSSIPLVLSTYSYAAINVGGIAKQYYIVGSNDNSVWYPIQYANVTTNPFTAQAQNMTSSITVNYTGSQVMVAGQQGEVTTTAYSTTTGTYTYFRVICTQTVSFGLYEYCEFYMNFTKTPTSTTIISPSTTLSLSPSGQTALSTNVQNPILIIELNFEGTPPGASADYADSVGGVTYVSGGSLSIGGVITISSAQTKVGSTSLLSTNGAGSVPTGYVYYSIGTPITMSAFTMGAWIHPTALSSTSSATPFGLSTTSLTGPYLTLLSTGQLQCYYFTTIPLSAITLTTTISIPINTWSHIAAVFSMNTLYLYINGILQVTQTYTGIPCMGNGLSPTNLVVGCAVPGYNGYAGYIDNLRIYNSALTPYQMQSIYANNFNSTTLTQLVPSFSVTPQQSGLTTNTWNQGGINWTASASSTIVFNPPSAPYMLFNTIVNYTQGDCWASDFGYNTTTGAYGFTRSTIVQGVGSPVLGEWFQLQTSVPLVMYSYSYAALNATCNAKTYYIVGSNDGQTWYSIQTGVFSGTNPFTFNSQSQTNVTYVNYSGSQIVIAGTSQPVTTTTFPTTTNAYTYFRVIGQSLWPNNSGLFEYAEFVPMFTGPTNTSLYNVISPLTNLSTGSSVTAGTVSGAITGSALSNTGQYMVVITNNTTGNNIYYSTNAGVSFTGLQLGSSPMTSCAISYDGSYITVSNATTVYTLNNNSTGYTVAIGNQAGAVNQYQNAIAIGNYAGTYYQYSNSIILNATGQPLNSANQGFYVAPIASYTASSSQTFSLLGYGSDNQIVQTGITSLYGANGNVGIGLTNPGAPLHIYSTTASNMLAITNATAGNSTFISFLANNAAYGYIGLDNSLGVGLLGSNVGYGFDIGTPTTTPLSFFTNNLPRMRIDSSGNVGIGITTPSATAKLHVVGNIFNDYTSFVRGQNGLPMETSATVVIAANTSGTLLYPTKGGTIFIWFISGEGDNLVSAWGFYGLIGITTIHKGGYINSVASGGSGLVVNTGPLPRPWSFIAYYTPLF